MIINKIKKENFEYILIDNFYNQFEFNDIKKEINYFLNFKQSPEITDAAFDNNGNYKKKGEGVWIDDYFVNNRDKSAILNLNRKIFDIEIYNEAIKLNLYFKHLKECNKDTTLVNYYSNSNFYEYHIDQSILTAITMFKIGNFEGGNFMINNDEIEFKENRTIIFSGNIPHKANPIICEHNNYRVTMAQFLLYQ